MAIKLTEHTHDLIISKSEELSPNQAAGFSFGIDQASFSGQANEPDTLSRRIW